MKGKSRKGNWKAFTLLILPSSFKSKPLEVPTLLFPLKRLVRRNTIVEKENHRYIIHCSRGDNKRQRKGSLELDTRRGEERNLWSWLSISFLLSHSSQVKSLLVFLFQRLVRQAFALTEFSSRMEEKKHHQHYLIMKIRAEESKPFPIITKKGSTCSNRKAKRVDRSTGNFKKSRLKFSTPILTMVNEYDTFSLPNKQKKTKKAECKKIYSP